MPKTPFWFLRHGETDYNARGLSQGALDIALNATGRAQAAQAAGLLAGRGIMRIVSSPMARTRETTAIVNETLSLPVTYEPGLREVIFGGMEGKPLSPWFADWLNGSSTPDGAERFLDLTDRVATALGQVLAMPGPVLIVAHGGVFLAVGGLLGVAMEGLTANAQPLYCEPAPQGWRVTPAALDGVPGRD